MQKNAGAINQRELPELASKSLDPSGTERQLILFNDEVNTFDFIIDSLIRVCSHTFEQAEQCTLIAHYKGKCVIKTGSDTEVQQCADALTRLKISVEVN
ncbi:MAG: ATP-dependent Clp protease adaptor ClpS [Bacteroidia bacterium]|nr:ATP-dependent Clp protease adaptor ClpS [Bacteroidia bacterium]